MNVVLTVCFFLHMMARIEVVLCLISITYCYGTPVSSRVGIFGGHSVSIQDAPYIASLRLFNSTAGKSQHVCGASIISDRFLLTAAHCVYPIEFMGGIKYEILVGTDKVSTGGDTYEVEVIKGHESFSYFERQYDIGIARLSKPIQFGPKAAKILLPEMNSDVAEGVQLNATGWGTTESDPDDLSNDLLQVSLPVVGRDKCSVEMEKYVVVTDKIICAGGNSGKDTCQGDSGGPLTLGNTLVGITSFGIGCGATTPGIYTNVANMLPWIDDKMKTL